MAKELFSREETNSRAHPKYTNTIKRSRNNLTGMEGVVFGEGKTHQEQRRFMLTTLKDFGFGKSNMDGLINEEVRQFCDSADETLISAINKEDVSLQYFSRCKAIKSRIISEYIHGTNSKCDLGHGGW